MASKDKILLTTRLLKQTFRIEGEEVAQEWGRALEGMTNAQVDVAVAYMRENHTSPFPPPFAAFKQWGVAASRAKAANQRWWNTHEIETIVDSQGRHIALCESVTLPDGDEALRPILVPVERKRPVRLSEEEFALRKQDLIDIMNGKLSAMPWKDFKNLRRGDLQKRNWLREAIGWPRLSQP